MKKSRKFQCWFCAIDIEEDVVKKYGSAINVPIFHPHPRGKRWLIHLTIPNPIHRSCYTILFNIIDKARREKRDDELFKENN